DLFKYCEKIQKALSEEDETDPQEDTGETSKTATNENVLPENLPKKRSILRSLRIKFSKSRISKIDTERRFGF
ncbi:10216_t:CDS:1, partial [Racocetra fulgida]